MNKIFFLFITLNLCVFAQINAQSPFPTFVYQLGVDFNHYSIEQSPLDNTYVIAGTLFRPSGDTEIHLMKVDFNGMLMWEVTSNAGWDDRGLDVMVDPNTAEIVVVGYTDAVGSSPADIYMGKWDAGGAFINDLVININNAGPSFPCAATNIIYSPRTGQYIVGGFWAENFNFPLVAHNYSIVFSVDPGLSGVNWVNNFTSSMAETNSSINDIVETSSGLIFATGSMGLTGGAGRQGVLAVILDPGSGSMIQNLSFESTNSEHVGVSAVYDDTTDEMWLMSNNSIVHNPQINLISNFSGGAYLNPSVSYYLELDPTYGAYNAAGFTLLPHYDHPHDVLTAVGYYRTRGSSGNDATLWYAEFKRYSGAIFNPALEWLAPSANFHAHGGGLFSTFSGEHPYIFNQEILVDNLSPSPNTSRYVALAPSDHSGNYGVEIIPIPGYSDCFKEFKFKSPGISFNNIAVNDYLNSPNYLKKMGVSGGTGTYQEEWCWVKPREDVNDPALGDIAEVNHTVSLIPNPAVDRTKVTITGADELGKLMIWDVTGQKVFESSWSTNVENNIDLGAFTPGVYMVQYQGTEGSVFEKLIKQ